MLCENEIVLSIVLRVVGGKPFVRRNLSCLAPQIKDRPIEVIVPYDSSIKCCGELKQDYPQVTFVFMGEVKTGAAKHTHAAAHELYDRRTAKGLRVARGEILALLEDYGIPKADWCDQVLYAHNLSHGVIGGAVEHEGKGILNWAVYFLDFGRYQLPLSEQPVQYLTDVNVSYKREVLESIREVWAEEYNEVAVHWALAKKGVLLWLRPQIVVSEDRGELFFADLIKERFAWGRLFGCMRARQMTFKSRLLYIFLSPGIPVVLLARMIANVFKKQRNWGQFILSLPLTIMLTSVWCIGELFGYITSRAYSGS